MRALPPLRYGVELEGPHKGLQTLVLLSVVYHTPEAVQRALDRKPGDPVLAEHLWLERQERERYSWHNVRRLLSDKPGMPMTLLVIDDGDVPPERLRSRLSLVWRVPEACRLAAVSCGHLQVLTGPGPFEGCEVTVQGARAFSPAEYAKDETWNM